MFVKLFVNVLIYGTSVGEICVKELNVELFGNYMESDGQCFREPSFSLQFCMPSMNLNLQQAQFCSSNKGGFTYDMRFANWIESMTRNASKLSVRQATKDSDKIEALIFDQENHFQQRVSYLEKVTGLLKSNLGLSFARYFSVLITSISLEIILRKFMLEELKVCNFNFGKLATDNSQLVHPSNLVLKLPFEELTVDVQTNI